MPRDCEWNLTGLASHFSALFWFCGLLEVAWNFFLSFFLCKSMCRAKPQGGNIPKISCLGWGRSQVPLHILELSLSMGFTHQNAKGEWDHELENVKIKPAVKFPSFKGACPVQHEVNRGGEFHRISSQCRILLISIFFNIYFRTHIISQNLLYSLLGIKWKQNAWNAQIMQNLELLLFQSKFLLVAWVQRLVI
jgi:hypothetical protein